MKKKRTMILIITLALAIVMIGTSYAYFSGVFDSSKPEDNTLNTETLSDTVMISDVEDNAGSFTASRIYPGHKEVASIKVNVTGKQNSKIGIKFIYDVEENGMNDHIKISIYKSKKKIETKENYFNCKTIINTESDTAKYYETCEEKDLELLIGEKTLHGGKEELDVVTDTIMITEEESPEEYYYYAVVEFINIETSQNEDMDKVLKGKVNVEVVPPEKKTFEKSVVAYGKLGNNIAKSMLYSSYLDQENLLYDETIDNNLRYVGANPNNYVLFNDELWRVIGVMNNVEDANGMKDSRIKLIRDESIGEYSWDLNNRNNWNTSTIKNELNSVFLNEINDDKNMIEPIMWNIGYILNSVSNYTRPSLLYSFEKNTKEKELIGLISPSDYGYAVYESNSDLRNNCLSIGTRYWANTDCLKNNWLFKGKHHSTINALINNSNYVFYISEDGNIYYAHASGPMNVFPSLYLKNYIQITNGNGTKENPYILEMSE